MPILTLACPDCGNRFQSVVFNGTKPPELWVCSRCGSDRAAPAAGTTAKPHPWESGHTGCACCG